MKNKIVTTRALIARINRKLKPAFEALRKTRGEANNWDLGDYYVINWQFNYVVSEHVDPESYGRELGVLRDSEVVAEGMWATRHAN